MMARLISLSTVVLLLVAGTQAATTVPVLANSELDTISIYIKATLENLREAMPKGIPELSIPPLEPLTMPIIEVPRISENLFEVRLDFKDFVLKGLSSFAVRGVKAHLDTMSIELELFFPEVAATANYDLSGKALIFPLYGKGPASIKVNDLNIHVAASVSIEGMEKVQLSNLRVDMTFSQVQVNLVGIGGGGTLGQVINALINVLGKLMYDKLKDQLLPEVNRILRIAVNNELAKVNLKDILGGMLPYSQPVDDSANAYVDKLMENLRPHIRQNNLDPVGIPDQHVGFSKKILLITVSGSARIFDGRAHGLSTIHRAGNCDIGAQGTRVNVGCVIGVNGIQGSFTGRAEFMGIGVNVGISIGVNHVRVAIRVSADVTPGSRPGLEHFSITEVSQVNVSVNGLGPLDWILNPVANVVVNAVRHHIVATIENPIRQELIKVLGTVSIPSFP